MARSRQAMKVTTVRFGADLWRILEEEAGRVGISVSQYIREAALARAAAASGARGEDPLLALGQMSSSAALTPPETPSAVAGLDAAELRREAQALSAQSRQAVRHADALLRRRDAITGKRQTDPAETELQE